MACNYPVTAYYADTLTDSGKRPITFNRKSRYLGTDPTLSGPISVPCGKCLGCHADQSLMWSIRAYHESQQHERNSFVTLTYDDAHLPADGKISKDELQRFFKRLRKEAPNKIRYFACGEYGSKTRRPHYHAIIFGEDYLGGSIPIDDRMYTNQKLVDIWGNGMVSIAPVNMSTICYTCGYVHKKCGDPDTFTLMSRRPGIGHDWLDRWSGDLLRTGTVTIEGREYPVPKRYLNWQLDELVKIKNDRRQYAKNRAKKLNLSPTQIRARADAREAIRAHHQKDREEKI